MGDGDEHDAGRGGVAATAGVDARLRAAEDQLGIFRTVSRCVCAVDGLVAGEVAACHTPDATYRVGDLGVYRGRVGIVGMVENPGHGHIARVAEGVAHLAMPPHVAMEATGEQASATNHMIVLRHRPAGFGLWRTSASRMELVRHPDGWAIDQRENQPLDGSGAGPPLLARLKEPPASAARPKVGEAGSLPDRLPAAGVPRGG